MAVVPRPFKNDSEEHRGETLEYARYDPVGEIGYIGEVTLAPVSQPPKVRRSRHTLAKESKLYWPVR
jgi:hypothetical protein